MDKNFVDFICCLHGYLIRVKEIHWNTTHNSTHLLCDEIEDDIHGCEDRFAECVMGMADKKFEIGKLIPLLPNATDLKGMLNELNNDVIEMKKKIADKEANGGLFNILDDLQEVCNKYKYRCTQL